MGLVSLIAAMDENRGLGCENKLLCHLPADLNYFKTMTMGKPIIMGRKTFASIGVPLPGRQNIVISSQSLQIAGITLVHSLQEALQLTQYEPETMIIGGAKVFSEAMPLARRIYLTQIHHRFERADVFFPKIEKSIWKCVHETHRPRDDKNAYDLTFFVYERI
ncbi:MULTISPECIES: dihydrofolate reductase [Legionella]|uniref:Dihydrofolate reductase n=1 Tax=Legionella septentrionalis TaxID=2498109 RepID=A0A3S0V4J6_9GAMM|nr:MULTISPECIES: dihydrofolate reductase [Legionella]MCP0913795.1 dihydrofolate reductase [Legionella sp. 27cVA30]RUQ81594.1 dihydrofolate reductase [Legionella septentrionalis]RUQ96426.1 dihydrofolate reductase [Legionella septentrionalis]RUR09671.1 dihydrofolate reductase [Legionella septentrionalis]RUR14507.1 dihydrofolate reductase [Legionella septentrionalis]